ncbi:MAG: hypothetical protein HFG35_02360 [Eubacterium sp.]|nr:hypothetical protein [Eubacterium sp.]
MHFKEFYACPSCGRAISGEKQKYFVCPVCGRALCREQDFKDFDDNYCGNCGSELASAKKEALALAREDPYFPYGLWHKST